MKNKLLSLSTLMLSLSLISQAAITITVPAGSDVNKIDYMYAPIKQLAEAKSRAERGVVVDSIGLLNDKAEIAIPTTAESYFYLLEIDSHNINLYVVPEENIDVNIKSFVPFSYELSGSVLTDEMNKLHLLSESVTEKIYSASPEQQKDQDYMQSVVDEYNKIQKDFIENYPESAAAPVALLNLERVDFINYFEKNKNSYNSSIVYPLLAKQYETEKINIEKEKKQQQLQSGEIEAPGFTLKNLEGKNVSLKDFRGKWVILDFWGSWCPWCIKGFPELKEAYEKYSGILEIIGIDCNESKKEWKLGVEKYELPWVNVYNPSDTDLLEEYGVQGFPTKAIINPEGKIVNITVGHDPNFLDLLEKFITR